MSCRKENIRPALTSAKSCFMTLRVYGDHQVNAFAAAEMALFADTNFVPGRQTLNIGWKNILRRDRDPHPKNGLGEQGIGTAEPVPLTFANLTTRSFTGI